MKKLLGASLLSFLFLWGSLYSSFIDEAEQSSGWEVQLYDDEGNVGPPHKM